MTDAVERYLLLGLRLGRHVDGLVDYFYGPDELRRRVDGEPIVPARELALHAAELHNDLEDEAVWLQEQVGGDEALAYVERWRLLPRHQAEQVLAFLTDPTWRAYSSTYTEGRRICAAWAGDDLGRLARLLREQIAVSELQAAGAPV